MKIKAALFDLDGTLIDSMWVWERLLRDFLVKHNLKPIPEVIDKIAYMSLAQSSVYVRDVYGLSMTAEEILAQWRQAVYHAYAEEITLKPGAKDYLEKQKEKKVKIGLVTACDPTLVQACLKHNGVLDLFDAITYVDDVGIGKQMPDIYEEALRRLQCKAEEAVLFEDILVGVRTAKKMGLHVVAVEDSQEEKEALKQEADLYIRNFLELT